MGGPYSEDTKLLLGGSPGNVIVLEYNKEG